MNPSSLISKSAAPLHATRRPASAGPSADGRPSRLVSLGAGKLQHIRFISLNRDECDHPGSPPSIVATTSYPPRPSSAMSSVQFSASSAHQPRRSVGSSFVSSRPGLGGTPPLAATAETSDDPTLPVSVSEIERRLDARLAPLSADAIAWRLDAARSALIDLVVVLEPTAASVLRKAHACFEAALDRGQMVESTALRDRALRAEAKSQDQAQEIASLNRRLSEGKLHATNLLRQLHGAYEHIASLSATYRVPVAPGVMVDLNASGQQVPFVAVATIQSTNGSRLAAEKRALLADESSSSGPAGLSKPVLPADSAGMEKRETAGLRGGILPPEEDAVVSRRSDFAKSFLASTVDNPDFGVELVAE